jgi:hypothetical protein
MASTLKVTDIQHPSSGVSALTVGSDNSVSIVGGALSPQTGFRNRIINGSMTIDQRNAGASVTPLSGQFITDRFRGGLSQNSKYTAQQSTTAPTGFINSLLITALSTYAVGADDFFDIRQPIEGFNIADLGWGTANAQTVTLSFMVRSSLTGTFGGALKNSAGNRSYPFSYTIFAANTFEYKTIIIPGDTTGTWLTNNGVGIFLQFGLGVGSTFSGAAGAWAAANYVSATGATSVVGTNGATWYVTGVQLEKGSTATPFEFRSIGQELMLCQRYFSKTFNQATAPVQNSGSTSGAILFISQAVQLWDAMWRFPVQMRASPTIVTYSTNAASSNWSTNTDTPTASVVGTGEAGTAIRASTPGAAGRGYSIHATASIEL